MRLRIKHDQCREENVEHRYPKHSQQHALLFPDDLAQDLNLFGVPNKLDKPKDPQKPSHSEDLKPSAQDAESR